LQTRVYKFQISQNLSFPEFFYFKYIIIAKENKKLKIDVYNTSISENINMIFKVFFYVALLAIITEMWFSEHHRSFRTQLFRDLDSRTHVDRAPLQD